MLLGLVALIVGGILLAAVVKALIVAVVGLMIILGVVALAGALMVGGSVVALRLAELVWEQTAARPRPRSIRVEVVHSFDGPPRLALPPGVTRDEVERAAPMLALPPGDQTEVVHRAAIERNRA